MVGVRSSLPGDVAGIESVLLAAFGSPVGQGDVVRMSFEPHHISVAVEDDAVVGVVASTQYGTAAYVGPMAVHPEHQHKGIGSALLSGLIDRLEGRGVRSMSLEASEAGLPLYAKHGFVKIDMTLTYARTCKRDDVSVASLGSPGSGTAIDDALNAALTLDGAAYDYDRRAVFRQLLDLTPAPTILLGASGYAVARTTLLGPWVTTNHYDAASLFERALAVRPSLERVLAPQRNAKAARLLSGSGFSEASIVTHMIRGPERVRREYVYGIISPSFG